MRRRRSPAGRLRGGLDGVADVLAVAEAGETKLAPRGVDNGVAIAGIGARLLAADEQLGGAIRAAVNDVSRRMKPGRSVEARRPRRVRLGRRLAGDPVLAEALASALAAEAAFPIAAEAGRGVEQVGRIDPHHSRLDAGGDLERAIDVLAPDRGREAVAGVVGERDRFVGRAEGGRDQNGAENLLA